ncbi:MAG: hypothetical protein LBG46_02000, partial [Elusimicrobiota bacterium]|nr:hypothetical protein [Elusimicrobiota bacterium]
MHTIKGIAASPGIAIGPAFVVKPDSVALENSKIPVFAIKWEIHRYTSAVERTLEDLNRGEAKVKELFGENYARLMEAHKLILKDPLLTDSVIKKIKKEHLSAESALYGAVREISANFENI